MPIKASDANVNVQKETGFSRNSSSLTSNAQQLQNKKKNDVSGGAGSDATLKEMQELIEKVHELGRERGWHDLVLTSQEMQEMINYYKS